MSENMLELIIKYLSDDIWYNKETFEESGDKNLERVKHWLEYSEKYADDKDKEKWLILLKKLEEIRQEYWKGKPFINNFTKGTKKDSLVNLSFHRIKTVLEIEGIDRGTYTANQELNYIRDFHSERSYYRLKKRIKDLGIDI